MASLCTSFGAPRSMVSQGSRSRLVWKKMLDGKSSSMALLVRQGLFSARFFGETALL